MFLLCNVIMILSTAWAWAAGSFYQLLAAVCLQGLAEGISASTVGSMTLCLQRSMLMGEKMLLMVIDLTFIHQRPQAIAIFWSLSGVASLVALSLVPTLTNAGSSWRTFYLVYTIPSAFALVLALFLYPETYFLRPAIAFDGHVLVQSATEKVKVYEGWEEVPGGKALPDTPEKSKLRAIMKELRVWGTVKGGWKAMMACYPQILMCVFNPLIFWVALLNAAVFASMISIGMTYVTLLSAEPYSFPIQVIALINLSAAVGALLAWPVSGIMIARITRRLAMRNGGVRDAEHYLPAFVLPILSGATSAMLYGVAGQRKWHWIWIYISYALNAFSSVSLGTANTLWVTEAFPRWAGAALVVVGGGSYIASFGMSFVILPWIQSQGFAGENIEIAVVILVVGGILIPIAFWGKRLRQHIHSRWGMSEKGALRPQ